jgi:hypothetical protein
MNNLACQFRKTEKEVTLREQQSRLGYQQTGQRNALSNRQQVPVEQPASRHRVGHDAGLHPEDQPYVTGSMAAHRAHGQVFVDDEQEIEEDESYYSTHLPTSARRYNTTSDEYIIRQGNRKFVVHDSYPPVRQRRQLPPPHRYRDEQATPKPRHRTSFLVWIGAAICIMLFGFVAFSSLGTWVQAKQDDWTYGQTRHFTMNAVVGHTDSPSNPSHFIAENDRGNIFVIELPGGEASRAKIYQITTIPGNEANPPVRLSFQDINHDGKLDLVVQIGDTGNAVTVILLNNGSQFVSKV